MIEAEQAQLRGEPERAMQHLIRAVEIYPDYVDALNNLGTYYQRMGEHDQAISLFYRVVDLEPGFYGGWVNLGGCLMAKGEFQQAKTVARRALELRPADPLVMGQYALANYYLRDYGEAKKYFTRVLEKDPAAANSPQLFLAQIEISAKNMDKAVVYMQDFLKWHPNAPEAAQVRNTINNLTSPNFLPPGELARTDPE
jgi:Tfp pilus assembly protein PilF